ncbi:hypothetical protein ACFQ9H_30990 [Streptomyces sp. NPDC056517]|uniref:hypothetical protein n=1 Tax=unclassified Streptomyces TaxID=2593676 RepID=UPI0036CE248C
MTLVPPVPVSAAVTVAPDDAAVNSAAVTSTAPDSTVVDHTVTEPEPEPVSVPAPEPAPEPVGPTPTATPGPRLRHVRIDPPAGARGEAGDPSPRVPGTPPRFGVVAVPQPSRTTSDRRSGTPSVRPVRLTDTAAAPVGLPGATERPAAVTPVPLPVPRPATPAGPVTAVDPAGPVTTPADPPPTESRTEEPQP